jgi:Pyruvate/2-oxoacid:ferredoxin oxidoreductase delta subunit
MKHAELKYFTGTGNSRKVLQTCGFVFTLRGYTVNLSSITEPQGELADANIVGFCFPVYAFGIPRLCRKYLKALPRFTKPQNVFVIITAGDQQESGFSTGQCKRLLRKINGRVIYTAVVKMPVNWTTFMDPPTVLEASSIIEKGTGEAEIIAHDILNGVMKFHRFQVPPRYGWARLLKEFLLFRYLGLYFLWRTFAVYDTCNGCGVCARICPSGSITMFEGQPKWFVTCEQCMRCVNYCPQKAIYQSKGGSTKERNRYHEPEFDPLSDFRRNKTTGER